MIHYFDNSSTNAFKPFPTNTKVFQAQPTAVRHVKLQGRQNYLVVLPFHIKRIGKKKVTEI
jgi:hypothetical protein